MYEYQGDREYGIWSERMVISDCLRKLGFEKYADKIHTLNTNTNIIDIYVSLIKKTAEHRKDNDVLERMCLAGLIYG